MLYSAKITHDHELHIFQDFHYNFHAVISFFVNQNQPALGGCRFIEYNSIEHATNDAMRLSIAMRKKALASNLSCNGGKAVIIRPTHYDNRKIILKKFAECVQSLQGKYITTIDSGTTPEDMSYIKQFTPYVAGCLESENQFGSTSAATALGVLKGIQAVTKYYLKKDTLVNLHIAIQGLGNVGYQLAKYLSELGAKLTICDLDINLAERYARELHAESVEPDAIYSVKCDIFSPCALGQVINHKTIPLLKTKIIAGAANDQLATDHLIPLLNERGILYISDFIINAGGLIHLALQSQGKGKDKIHAEIMKIYDRVSSLLTK